MEGIDKWLESSGHAFELRVARAFRTGGASSVDLSFTYTDVETQLTREGDVLASFALPTSDKDAVVSMDVVVECKGGTSHPWVVFYDRRFATGATLDDWTYFAHGFYDALIGDLAGLWEGGAPFNVRQVASHVVAAFDPNRNPAGDAVRQVLAASAAWRLRHINAPYGVRGCIIVSVVVTAGRIVRCSLGPDGDLQTEEVTSAVVKGSRSADGRAVRVYVMTESHVQEFAADLARLVETARTHR